MQLFGDSKPLLRCKQSHLDVQDLNGLLDIHVKVAGITMFRGMYTRIDQVFLVWGVLTAVIFAIGQFLPISWHMQAWLGSIFSIVAIAITSALAWFWVRIEQLKWLVYLWGGLVLAGLLATNWSIYSGWLFGLTNLAGIWLIVVGIGYALTGWGLGSRTFLLAALLHISGALCLPLLPAWQFLFTGGLMASCLLLFAEVQWDMRAPIVSPVLTEEQQNYNLQQKQLRQCQ